MMAPAMKTALQKRIWRWHFFAGLMVVPFAVILAVTGAIYLFKPHFESAIEASVNERATPVGNGDNLRTADDLLATALAQRPDSSLTRMILPSSAQDPTTEFETVGPGGPRHLWLDRTTGEVLKDVSSDARFMTFIKKIHGTLLSGNAGSLVVEIMACWMIILVVTGVFLWWPRGTPVARAFVPDFRNRTTGREFWRKAHGAIGMWVSALALVILLSGLPWTQVWGAGYARVKDLAGLKTPGQEWFVTLQSSDPHAGHDMGPSLWSSDTDTSTGGVRSAEAAPGMTPLPLQAIVERLPQYNLAHPAQVQPPRGENGVWTIRAMPAYRPAQQTVHLDRWTGAEVMRIQFSDHNAADRIIALSVSFHEGALFGWPNLVIGVLAALSVAMLSVSGAVMWWKRRPKGAVGVPRMPTDRRIAAGVIGLIVALGFFLPMAGLTLLAALVVDAVVSRFRGTAQPA